MSQRLKPKRSNVVGKIPTTTDLEIGEIAVNMADQKIFVHEPGGTVVELGQQPDLTGYATEAYVTAQGYLTAHQDISSKADVATTYTKTEVDALIPTVPTDVSAFNNDSGYLTAHQDISGKADAATTLAGYSIADAYTKTEVDGLVVASGGYTDGAVDTHLNQSSAANDQVLSWTGTDYAWVDQSSDQFIEGGHSATIYGIDDLVIDAGGSA